MPTPKVKDMCLFTNRGYSNIYIKASVFDKVLNSPSSLNIQAIDIEGAKFQSIGHMGR